MTERKSTPPITAVFLSDTGGVPALGETGYTKLFNTHLMSVNFDKASNEGGDWIKRVTGGLIEGMVYVAPEPDTKLLLLNYMPFAGRWVHPFQETELDVFWGQSLLPDAHPLLKVMHGSMHPFLQLNGQKLRYRNMEVAGEAVQALELPFREDNNSMVILLPEERDGLEKMFSDPSFELSLKITFAALNTTTEERVVNVMIPKFRADKQYAFDFLQAPNVNVTDIFNDEANITVLPPNHKFHFTRLIHRSVIDLDENGSSVQDAGPKDINDNRSAAESTDAITFRADHPFLFYIRDSATGVIHFIGKIDELETV